MAGNEEHPFASIVAAYHESQATAPDADVATDQTAPTDELESVADYLAAQAALARSAEPADAEVASEAAADDLQTPFAAQEPLADVSADEVPPAEVADLEVPQAPVVPVVPAPDDPQASALVDPFKSILAAYYAQSTVPPAEVQPEPAAETAPASSETETSVAEPGDTAATTDPAPADGDPAAGVAVSVLPVSEPEATEAPTDPETAPTGAWARHSAPQATSAAASIVAAYYAETAGPAATAEELSTATPGPTAVPETPTSVGLPAATVDATAVLPALPAVTVESPLHAALQVRPTEEVDHHIEKDARSDARRTFLMLAPIGAIAALAVLAVLLWNGQKSTPKAVPAPTSTASIVLVGTPLRRTQEAYASALNRFINANDSGGAVVAGGAAHDTLKLLKDFKGATAQDKALLAAERAHLSSLADLASASPGSFSGAANQANNNLTAVAKAAAANPKAKAPNGSRATTQAIDLLGEGNVAKLQVALNSLVSRADYAAFTAQLRSLASDAAGNADAANSLAAIIKNTSVQATASSLANKFSSLAPMARLSGDSLNDWSNIRPGMVSALGSDPASHIDSLIANARQKLADWSANQANQGNTATATAIRNYANSMRSHFGAFAGALGQIPSLNSSTTCAAGAKSGARSQAGNAAYAVNRAAFGGNPPSSLVGAHNALVNAINSGSAAATAAQNVTVLCATTYGATRDWGTYSNNIWVKGGWGGKVGAWESAVNAALQQAAASASKPKPIV